MQQIAVTVILSLPSRERGLKYRLPSSLPGSPPSLPSRERGLKFPNLADEVHCLSSLPSRERGLKYVVQVDDEEGFTSLPSRERGLKYIRQLLDGLGRGGRSLAGAWIERKEDLLAFNALSRRSPRGGVD